MQVGAMTQRPHCGNPRRLHCTNPRPMATAVNGAPTLPAPTTAAPTAPAPSPFLRPLCTSVSWRSFPVTKGLHRVEVDFTRRAGGGFQCDGSDWPRVTARAVPGAAGEEVVATRTKHGPG